MPRAPRNQRQNQAFSSQRHGPPFFLMNFMRAQCARRDCKTMVDPRTISSELCQETFTDAFRRHVGRGKRWSAGDLSETSGIDERTINGYQAGEVAPSLYRLLRIAAVLGPAFMSDVLAPAGMGGVERLDPEVSDAQAVARALVRQGGLVLDRLADGVFCHRDKAITGPELIELAAKIERHGRAMCEEARPRVVGGGRS